MRSTHLLCGLVVVGILALSARPSNSVFALPGETLSLMPDDIPMINPAAHSAPSTQPESARVPNWELPAVTVVRQTGLKSDEPVGPYSQPRWTADRRFPGTRVYVVPYPRDALRRRLEGTVMLRVAIDEHGIVDHLAIKTSCGHEMLDQTALKTVPKWRFGPATKHGAPVACEVLMPIRFVVAR